MKAPGDLSLVLLILLLPPVWPITSNKYMTFYIPEYSRRYIYLEGKWSYSLQLVLHKGDPAHSYWGGATSPHNLSSSPSSDDPVEFIVKAPEYAYYGVMAIVQRLHFRTRPFSLQNNQSLPLNHTHCRDYIQFSAEGGKGSSSIPPSPQLCGTLPRGNGDYSPPDLRNGPRSYFNPKGSIKLRVHVDSAVSHQDFADLSTIGAEIVFTGYTACPGTEVGLQTLRPCSAQVPSSPNHPHSPACIPASLFCDSKIDCGFPGEEFGLDENSSCYFPYVYGGAAILILLILLLLIYGFVHWVRIKTKRSTAEAGQGEAAGGPSRSQREEEQQGADPGMAVSCDIGGADMGGDMGAF